MFETGDKVVYGVHGVCCVTQIENQRANGKHLTYLVLEPIEKDGSKYMIPTHKAAAMDKLRRILTRPELEALLQSEAIRVNCWIENENQRKQSYRELLGGGDRARLMSMVRAVYGHRDAILAAGRKIHLCDENFLRDAEKLLCSEITVVMDMEQAQARQLLREALHP